MTGSPVKMWRSLQLQVLFTFVILSSLSAHSTVTFTYIPSGTLYQAVANNQRVLHVHGNSSVNFAGTHATGKTNLDVNFIQFNGGEIPSVIPQVFDVFPNVQQLIYSNNGLFHLTSGAFAKATKLQQLTIQFNFLPIIHDHPFKGATVLNLLQLQGNKIHRIEKTAFSDLTALAVINLSNNHIHRIDSDTFDGLPSLSAVDLTHNYCPNQKFQAPPSVPPSVALTTLKSVIQACPT